MIVILLDFLASNEGCENENVEENHDRVSLFFVTLKCDIFMAYVIFSPFFASQKLSLVS